MDIDDTSLRQNATPPIVQWSMLWGHVAQILKKSMATLEQHPAVSAKGPTIIILIKSFVRIRLGKRDIFETEKALSSGKHKGLQGKLRNAIDQLVSTLTIADTKDLENLDDQPIGDLRKKLHTQKQKNVHILGNPYAAVAILLSGSGVGVIKHTFGTQFEQSIDVRETN
jgi:hypothetical protein